MTLQVNKVDSHLIYARWVAGVCFFIHFIFSLIGWNHSLLDHHGNRQSFTALTAYYFVKDGVRFDYETPAWGVPWSCPVELPVYQGIVALIDRTTGWGIDQTGRGVSLFFFYAMLLVLYRLVIALCASRSCAWLAIAFCLASPVYLFWSKTFLQETTALFFSVLYLWGIAESHKNKGLFWVLLAMSAGILASTTKITTFVLALFLGTMMCLIWFFQRGKDKFYVPTLLKAGLMAVFYGLIPMAAALKWTSFADSLKAQNALAATLTSKMMMGWNFGSLHQRIFGQFHHIPVLVLFLGLIGIFVFLLFLAKGVRPYFAIFFFTFFLGPMVFTNLFIAHTYYWVENTVYLYLALAFVCYILMTNSFWAPWLRSLLIPVFLISMVGITAVRYLPGQMHDTGAYFVASARSVQEYVPPGGVLLVYGFGIDPSFPYYAQRKAIMVGDAAITDDAVVRTIDLTGPKNIKALVVGPDTNRSEEYFKNVADRFHLTKEIYLAEGQGMITQYDMEKYSFDWNDVSAKLVKYGWASRINLVEIRLNAGYDADKGRMAKVFGANFPGIYHMLQESHHFKCFVR